MNSQVGRTYPILGKRHSEMQSKVLPRSTRWCQNQTHFPQVSIVSEDGDSGIRTVSQLCHILAESGEQPA